LVPVAVTLKVAVVLRAIVMFDGCLIEVDVFRVTIVGADVAEQPFALTVTV